MHKLNENLVVLILCLTFPYFWLGAGFAGTVVSVGR